MTGAAEAYDRHVGRYGARLAAELIRVAGIQPGQCRSYEMFGRVVDDMDDERFIEGWVDVALAVAARHGLT